MEEYKILNAVTKHALAYLDELPGRRVYPNKDSLQQLEQLSIPLPESAANAEGIITIISTIGSANTVATNGGHYFGFVFGGTLPVSLAANWLVSAWDQKIANEEIKTSKTP